MLKPCFAGSLLVMVALALPVPAQSDTAYQLAQDDKACAAKGAGPDTDGYSQCMAQRKIDRFQEVQRRAADLAAMPKVLNPMPADHTYLLPEETRALEGAPEMPKQTIRVTKVCVTEGDAAKPGVDGEAAKAPANCQTSAEVVMKDAPQRGPQDDPASPRARTATRPGDFEAIHEHDSVP